MQFKIHSLDDNKINRLNADIFKYNFYDFLVPALLSTCSCLYFTPYTFRNGLREHSEKQASIQRLVSSFLK